MSDDRRLKTLPTIMVAPNGARRTKADHPALPVTIEETVAAARACFEAGAGALHAHVRDTEQNHVLDAGLYRELITEMHGAVPSMPVQITTEAVGRYSPLAQRTVVREVMPEAVSVAFREMLPDAGETQAAREFYYWASEADISVQHILYEPAEIGPFFDSVQHGVVPAGDLQLLFVLGRYTPGQQSNVADLLPILQTLDRTVLPDCRVEWGLCAFGVRETDCLVEAVRRGGKARIGFENSLWNSDGSVASDNAERVRELRDRLDHAL